MKKMKSVLALILALVMALSLVACGGGNEGGGNEGGGKMKIALVLPGKKDDVSFNQAMYRGAMEYAEKHADTVELKSGDAIVTFTDGVTEACSAANELYGEQRLETLLKDCAPCTARQTVTAINDAVRSHAEGTEQSDDITVLVLKRA